MTKRLAGKTAVISGAASGIGQASAVRLAADGAQVVIADRAKADETLKMIADGGAKALAVACDVSDPASVAALKSEIEKNGGRCDILVNNAGIQHVAPIDQFPDDKWNAIIAVNLSAAFHGTKAALPVMRQRRWGRIVNIASVHGLVASEQKVAYVAAKHGIVGMTKVTALETANDGITCNAICPGWVLTPLVEKQIAARAKESGRSVEQAKAVLLGEKQPMLEFSTTEQIGELVVFLCGDGAATVTGAALSIDGGWAAQ